MIIFTKFHKDWTKIVDFLLIIQFWGCTCFLYRTLYTRVYYHLIQISTFLVQQRWQEAIAAVSLDDICDIRERNCAARMLDINFVEEIAWLK